MSAFVVDPYHVRYLRTWAYLRKGEPETPRREDGSHYTTDEAMTLLWNECVRSVAYRYPGDQELPGMIGYTSPLPVDSTLWHLTRGEEDFRPGRVLAALACLEYQSCECPDYEQTPAYAYLESLRREAIRISPSFENTWEIQEPVREMAEA